MLIKPKRLQAGDIVATVSPSWGGAGDPEIRWRYDQGKMQVTRDRTERPRGALL
ncbi:hypothetical protein bcgnr5369_68450 [Bacillus cereus]